MAPRTRSQQQSTNSPLKEPLEREPRRTRARAASAASAAGAPASSAVDKKNTGTKQSKKKSSSKKRSKTSRAFEGLLDGTPIQKKPEEDPVAVPVAAAAFPLEEEVPQVETNTQPTSPEPQHGTPEPLDSPRASPSPLSSGPVDPPSPPSGLFGPSGPFALIAGVTPSTPPRRFAVAKTRRKTVAPVNERVPADDSDSYDNVLADVVERRVRQKLSRLPPACGTCKTLLVCPSCNESDEVPAAGPSSQMPQHNQLTSDEAPETRKRSLDESEHSDMPTAKRLNLGELHHNSQALGGSTPQTRRVQKARSERPARRTWFPTPISMQQPDLGAYEADVGRSIINEILNPAPDSFRGIPGLEDGIKSVPTVSRLEGNGQESEEYEPTAGQSTQAATNQGSGRILSSTDTEADAEDDNTQQRPSWFGSLKKTLSKAIAIGRSPSTTERPIAQPGPRRATSNFPRTDTSSTPNPSSLGALTSPLIPIPPSMINLDDHRPSSIRRHASINRPQSARRVPKRFQHRDTSGFNSDQAQAGTSAPFKAFNTPEEYAAEQRRWLAEQQEIEEQKRMKQREWLHERRIERRQERVEESAKTGEKRKRESHNPRIPYEGYVPGAPRFGRGFVMNHDEYLSSDEDTEDGENLVKAHYSDSSSPGDLTLIKAKGPKRVKFADNGVRTLKDGTQIYPDSTVVYSLPRTDPATGNRVYATAGNESNGVPIFESVQGEAQRMAHAKARELRKEVEREAAEVRAVREAAKARAEQEPQHETPKAFNPHARVFRVPSPTSSDSDEDDTLTPGSNTAAIPSVNDTTPTMTEAPVSAPEAANPSTSAEFSWTQPPPAPPSPAHASLPSQETGPQDDEQSEEEQRMVAELTRYLEEDEAAEATLPGKQTEPSKQPPTEHDTALAKQLAALEKFKPKKSSKLRQERTVDSPLAVVSNERVDHKWRNEVQKAIMAIDVDHLENIEFPETKTYVETGVVTQEVQDQLDHDWTPDAEALAINGFNQGYHAYMHEEALMRIDHELTPEMEAYAEQQFAREFEAFKNTEVIS